MKLLNSKHLLTVVFSLILSVSFAQDYDLSGVDRFRMRNAGSIISNRVIKGYYFFYESSKHAKGKRNYTIVILDENLKELTSQKMIESDKVYLVEASYNNTSILLKFFDLKQKKVMYRSVNNEGELSDKSTRVANKYEVSSYQQSYATDVSNLTLNPFGTNMFLDYYIFKGGKGYTFKLDAVDSKGEKLWTYAPAHTGGIDAATYMAADNDQALFLVYRTEKTMSRDYKFSVLSIDASGKKRFQIKMESPKHNLMPHHAYIDKDAGTIMIVGEYYDSKDKSFKAASKGIFIKMLSLDGEELSQKFLSWEKKIYAKLSEDERSDAAKYYMYFHQIIKTADGKIIAVAEQYRKQVSATGGAMKVAASALGGTTNASALEIKIGDLAIIVIDTALKVDEVKIIDKHSNHIVLPQGYEYVSQHLLARIIKSEGGFDYYFTQADSANSKVTFGYIDREKVEGKNGRKDVFNAVNYASEGDGKFTSDKIILSTNAYEMDVMPAKPGFILIYEYFRKDKKVSIRLEPINF